MTVPADAAANAGPVLPPGLRTLAVLHLAETSGPSKTLKPSLERLAAAGSLEVVVPGRGRAADDYAGFAEITTLQYEPITFPRGPVELARAGTRLAGEVRAFRRRMRDARPDLVVIATTSLPSPLVAARLERVPAIVRVAEIFDRGHVGGAARAAAGRANARLATSLADALVCSSEAIARQFGGRDVTVRTIYPGIAPGHGAGEREALRRAHGLEDARPLVAVVGNVTPGRGQDLVIRALPAIRQRFPMAACILAGTPHDRPADLVFREDLERLARKLGVESRVAFAGFVEQVGDVYAAGDVLVNPARFNEPFGRVALEALVAGCPVVSSRVGAIPEVLREGEDALLVPREDPAAIAAAVSRLAADPELAARMAESGRRRVLAEFGEERVAEQFARVAAEVLAG